MYAFETEDELPPSARGKPPGTYIRTPVGWAGIACLAFGLFGVVAADISLTGWLFSIALWTAGPALILLDLNGQIAQPRTELGGGVARRVVEYLVLASVVLLACVLVLRLDAAQAAPQDLSPGAIVDEGPDRVNPGCPVRTWSVGDYVPEVCLDRHSYARFAYHEGVEVLWTRRRSLNIRTRLWVRLGRDLAGGFCAPHAGCRIATLVKDRFSMGGPEAQPGSDGDFQREPPAYAIASAGSLVMRVWPLLILGLLLVEGRSGLLAADRSQAGRRASE